MEGEERGWKGRREEGIDREEGRGERRREERHQGPREREEEEEGRRERKRGGERRRGGERGGEKGRRREEGMRRGGEERGKEEEREEERREEERRRERERGGERGGEVECRGGRKCTHTSLCMSSFCRSECDCEGEREGELPTPELPAWSQTDRLGSPVELEEEGTLNHSCLPVILLQSWRSLYCSRPEIVHCT